MSEKDSFPPYDCPHYWENWNCDEMCKLTDDYCEYDEFLGCEVYEEFFPKEKRKNE